MYSDKIFPRPFPLFVSFFTLFSALLRRLCPYFRRSSPFFLSAPPPPNPVLSFSPPLRPSCTALAIAFPTFLYCAGVFFFALSYLPPPCPALSFSLCPLFFPVPRRPVPLCPFPFALSFFLSPAARLSCTVQALSCLSQFPCLFRRNCQKSGVRPVIFQTIAKRGTMPAALPPEIVF